MKIIVTGGAGFIGSHISDTYIKAGHKVVIIDNFHHGFKKNIHPKAKVYRADIRNLEAIQKIFKKERPDIVNHHAAISEVVTSVRNPLETMGVNVQGTLNLLLASGEASIKKFIFSSTGGVIYGNAPKLPANETTATAPLSPYGLSKLLGEQSIEYYARNYKFAYTIFRYGNVYGPRQDPKGEAGVIAIFAELLKHNKPVTIYGTGKNQRDYVYIDDIARANVSALTRGKNAIINLGSGKPTSVKEVYATVASHYPNAKKPRFKTLRTGEVMHIYLSNAKAKKLLNWKPRVVFSDGVQRYIQQQ